MASSVPPDQREVDVLVVGGGVAASTFVNTFAQLRPNVTLGLVSPSPLLKEVSVLASTGRTLDQLQVHEVSIVPSQRLVHFEDSASGLNARCHKLMTASGGVIGYKYLCICTGARPHLLSPDNGSGDGGIGMGVAASPFIVGLRDTESVDSLTRRLGECRKILLVGNGGIATELVYELKNCHIIWAVKDQAISATFFDAATANFFVPKLTFNKSNAEQSRKSLTSRRFVAHSGSNAALGPDWSFMRCLQGALQEKNVTVLYGCHVESIRVNENLTKDKAMTESGKRDDALGDDESPSPSPSCDEFFPVTVKLSNGQSVDCDLIISATGVTPNVQPFLCNNDFALASDGAFKVNRDMETSVKDVFAAGDVCHPEWQDECELWLHMRLWTQARQMALYAAHCIDSKFEQEEGCSTSNVKSGEEKEEEEVEDEKEKDGVKEEENAPFDKENNFVPSHRLYFNFDIFSHVTTFFGYKVVLLGLFNGQRLNNDYKILFRQDEDVQCMKLVIKNGKIKGAILIGDTDLEETFENLILSQIDVSRIEEQLLDGIVDIEDYFD